MSFPSKEIAQGGDGTGAQRRAPTIRRRILGIGLTVMLAATILGGRLLAGDITAFTDARAQAAAIDRVVALTEASEAVRIEWVAARDSSAATSSDYATNSDLHAERAAQLLTESGKQHHLDSINATDIALSSDQVTDALTVDLRERLAALDDVRARAVAEDVTTAELDLFYRRLVRELDSASFEPGTYLRSNAIGSVRSTIDRQERAVDLAVETSELRLELTVAIASLVTGRPTDWSTFADRLDAIEAHWRAMDGMALADAEWLAIREDLAPLLGSIDTATSSGPAQLDPEIRDLIDTLVGARTELRSVNESLFDHAATLGQQISEAGRSSRSRAVRRAAMSGGLVLLTLAVTLFAGRRVRHDIVVPLRAAAETAGRVSRGNLNVDRLSPAGPEEVRAVASTLDDLVATIATIERQSKAMVAGKFDDPVLQERLPGELGASLEMSIGAWRETTAQLEHELFHDSLTGVASRHHFLRKAAEHLASEQVSVALISLDRFKEINHSAGHHGGDQVLKIVARRLQTSAHPRVSEVARTGNDQFGLLIATDNLDEALAQARNTMDLVTTPIGLNGRSYELTATIGIATGDDIDSVLRNASQAVRHGKEMGGNVALAYDHTFEDRLERRRTLELELRRAIDNDELELWFQPVIDVRTGELRSCEALVRWRLPDGTLRLPATFVPIAEESALIIDLDQWVIDRAAQQLAEWQGTAMRSVDVAVNVSARHLGEGDLTAAVVDAASRWEIDTTRLAVEITESFLADDLAGTRDVLRRLNHLGLKLLIDDFGTGYSSLSYLQDLPFDVLKIDQAFVARIETDETSASIVAALIGLGHTMGLSVLAEGIETQEQLDVLRVLGCDEGQGYFIARPMPEVELRKFAIDGFASRQSLTFEA